MVWKRRPPGPEQQAPGLLFESGKIVESTTAIEAQRMDPKFSNFNKNCFRVNFNKIREENGFNCTYININLYILGSWLIKFLF